MNPAPAAKLPSVVQPTLNERETMWLITASLLAYDAVVVQHAVGVRAKMGALRRLAQTAKLLLRRSPREIERAEVDALTKRLMRAAEAAGWIKP